MISLASSQCRIDNEYSVDYAEIAAKLLWNTWHRVFVVQLWTFTATFLKCWRQIYASSRTFNPLPFRECWSQRRVENVQHHLCLWNYSDNLKPPINHSIRSSRSTIWLIYLIGLSCSKINFHQQMKFCFIHLL